MYSKDGAMGSKRLMAYSIGEKKKLEHNAKASGKSWCRKEPKQDKEEEKATAIQPIKNINDIIEGHTNIGLKKI